MARTRLIVDGETYMDGGPGIWKEGGTGPAKILQYLKPNATVAPWMKAALFAITQYGAMQTMGIAPDEHFWRMEVDTSGGNLDIVISTTKPDA